MVHRADLAAKPLPGEVVSLVQRYLHGEGGQFVVIDFDGLRSLVAADPGGDGVSPRRGEAVQRQIRRGYTELTQRARLAEDDIAILLSNSGETDEIVNLIPHLRSRNVKVISIIGRVDSTLAKKSDYILDASVESEACPLNLAPTSSTTVALVIGDAIALSLAKMKGVTKEGYAFNHPSGNLGKQLTIRVGDIMHGGESNPTLPLDASWMDVLHKIGSAGLGAVNIIDGKGVLKGLITDGDLRRQMEKASNGLGSIMAKEMMTIDPVVANEDMLAYQALKLMEERTSQISVLPVVDDKGKSIGIVRIHDIVRTGLG